MAAQNSVLTQIARPYASALFDLAQSENQLASVETSLSDVSRLIGESADFSRFLRSPVISGDTKATTLDALLAKANTNGLVANFLRLIAKNGRLFALDAIIVGFRELAAKARLSQFGGESRGEGVSDVVEANTVLVPDTRVCG